MAGVLNFDILAQDAPQYWHSAVYVVSMMFRVLAVAAMFPIFIFFLIELAGYAVILATGAHKRQRQFTAMVAESTEAISTSVANATDVGITKRKSDEDSAREDTSAISVPVGKISESTNTGAAAPVNTNELFQRAAT